MRFFLGTFVLLAGLVAGCAVALNSSNGVYYVSNSRYINVRNPALVQGLPEFSKLEGKAWDLLSRDRLLAEAFPIEQVDRTGFVFGHFITQDPQGKKYFACDLYNKIYLNFIAEGVMEGGEFTRMKVEAPCHATKNLNRLEPVWIPKDEILKTSPHPTTEFKFPSDVRVSFTNLTSEWPREWVLEEVNLAQDSKVGFSIRPKRPMTLRW